MYDYYAFTVNEYSKEEVMVQFYLVQKETMKNNEQWYPYTAYEYNGEIYYLFCFCR